MSLNVTPGAAGTALRSDVIGGEHVVHHRDYDRADVLAALALIASDAHLVAAIAGLASIDGHVDGLEGSASAILAALQGNLTVVAAATGLPVTAPPPASATVTILATTSLSGALQVDGKLAGIIIPAAWTAAAITFAASPDGVTYYDVYDAGIERTIAPASVVASHFIALPLSDWVGVKYVKVRSGLGGAVVAQAADRVITLVKAG
ncbi:MAG: hypothetical protein JWP35_3532 [Caulobacter sp.]|nr:hypothetical protein [Caulobacter sp.]